jgi:hypothetical protein
MASSMLVTVKRAEFRGKARELGAQAEAEAQAVPVPAVSERDERAYRRTNRKKGK